MAAAKYPPLALYIHIPWCVRKCPYCDFNSHQLTGVFDAQRYVDALLADLDHELPRVADRELVSIFIGGGTPSLMPADAMERLLRGVNARLPSVPGAEVTLEANPGTLEAGRFAGYRAAGVNRLSIGAQSFDARSLQRLGRIHGPDEAVAAVKMAREAGFDNINLDLMFGLPGQNRAMARRDVERAMELMPEHISYYQLTLEPNTRFAAQPPALPGEERICDFQYEGQRRLAETGYRQYEVSAYALPGKQCRHNLNYWTFGDYIGVGAGAHGKLTDSAKQAVWRRWRVRGPDPYQRAAGSENAIAGSQRLSDDDLLLEFMMNNLRLNKGFSRDLFQRRTGLPFSRAEPGISAGEDLGLLVLEDETVRPSEQGRRFLNDLLGCF